jgi:hypothetical protein
MKICCNSVSEFYYFNLVDYHCGITYVGVAERVETAYVREEEINVREMEMRGKPEKRD